MEIALVLFILIAAALLFATERFPVDQVALTVLASLLVLGLVTPAEGMSGFSSPATLTVAAMFVLSAGLQKTGAIGVLGHWLLRLGHSNILLLLLIMVSVAVISAFINNTAAVAVLMPVVLSVAAARKISASRLLIPLSYASQFGGVCTLIGTSTNLLVSAISEQAGYGAFSLFEFARLGLIMFVAGTLYFLLFSRWLLPSRREGDVTEMYQLGQYVTELRVLEDSPLVGKNLHETKLLEGRDVNVFQLLREEKKTWFPTTTTLEVGDVLLMRGNMEHLLALKADVGLDVDSEFRLRDADFQDEELTLVEVMVAPTSRLEGRTLGALDFHRRYSAVVLALRRRGRPLGKKLSDVRLHFGDAMLLLGTEQDIQRLNADPDFIVMQEVDVPAMRKRRARWALGIVAAVVGLAAFNVLPILVAAITGGLAMVFARCFSLQEAYEAIDWRVILLLAGILPLGIAMQNSGAAQYIADGAIGWVGPYGPLAVLAVLYLTTALLTEAMSNNASAVLLAPIAISSAVAMGVDPKPFLMAVTFAASTSFATPVGYQTNTMVYNAGGYRFTDFLRAGVPLNLLFWVLAVVFIPVFWPF